MTPGHFITRLKLTLNGNIDLDHFHNAWRQFVTTLKLIDLILKTSLKRTSAIFELLFQGFNFRHSFVIFEGNLPPLTPRHILKKSVRDFCFRSDILWTAGRNFAVQQFLQSVIDVAFKNKQFIIAVFGEGFDFLAFNRQRTLVFFNPVTVENPNLNNCSRRTGRKFQGGVSHIRSFFTKNGTQKFFFRCHWSFPFWCDFPDQNFTRIYFGADINNAGLIEVTQGVLTNIWYITRDFFRPQLRIAGHNLELFNVNRCKYIIAHNAFRNKD